MTPVRQASQNQEWHLQANHYNDRLSIWCMACPSNGSELSAADYASGPAAIP